MSLFRGYFKYLMCTSFFSYGFSDRVRHSSTEIHSSSVQALFWNAFVRPGGRVALRCFADFSLETHQIVDTVTDNERNFVKALKNLELMAPTTVCVHVSVLKRYLNIVAVLCCSSTHDNSQCVWAVRSTRLYIIQI